MAVAVNLLGQQRHKNLELGDLSDSKMPSDALDILDIKRLPETCLHERLYQPQISSNR